MDICWRISRVDTRRLERYANRMSSPKFLRNIEIAFSICFTLLYVGLALAVMFEDQPLSWMFWLAAAPLLIFAVFKVIYRKRLKNMVFEDVMKRDYFDKHRVLYLEARYKAFHTTIFIFAVLVLIFLVLRFWLELDSDRNGLSMLLFPLLLLPTFLADAYKWHLLDTKADEFGTDLSEAVTA